MPNTTPHHTTPHHSSPSLSFSPGGPRCQSGDAGDAGDEEDAGLISEGSHGRDNVIHIYDALPSLRGPSLAAGPNPSTRSPGIWKSLPSNSLNFCKFALLPLPPRTRKDRKNGKDGGAEKEALLAVPNLVDSELADIYHLPSMRRLHAGVNVPKQDAAGSEGVKGKGKGKAKAVDGAGDGDEDEVHPEGTRSGLIMSLHLGFLPIAQAMEAGDIEAKTGDTEVTAGGATGEDASSDRQLGLAMGYEDGRVEVWACASGSNSQGLGEEGWRCFSDGRGAVGPRRWELVFGAKGHNEAGE
jgi:hypothetical protein